jgi:hypothetical protein
VTPGDVAGLVGAGLMLAAFALVQFGRIDPQKLAALLLNFAGACLVVASLTRKFNLGAFVLEGAWALVALGGLARLGLRRLRGGRS